MCRKLDDPFHPSILDMQRLHSACQPARRSPSGPVIGHNLGGIHGSIPPYPFGLTSRKTSLDLMTIARNTRSDRIASGREFAVHAMRLLCWANEPERWARNVSEWPTRPVGRKGRVRGRVLQAGSWNSIFPMLADGRGGPYQMSICTLSGPSNSISSTVKSQIILPSSGKLRQVPGRRHLISVQSRWHGRRVSGSWPCCILKPTSVKLHLPTKQSKKKSRHPSLIPPISSDSDCASINSPMPPTFTAHRRPHVLERPPPVSGCLNQDILPGGIFFSSRNGRTSDRLIKGAKSS